MGVGMLPSNRHPQQRQPAVQLHAAGSLVYDP